MYELNLVAKALVKTQKNLKAVKFLKILSFFITVAILGLCAFIVYTFLEVYNYSEKINNLKMGIDEKRRIYKVKDVEAEWTLNYYKLLAIKDIIASNTKTGLMLREVGLYMPKGDKICKFSLNAENKIRAAVKIKDWTPKYDIKSYPAIFEEAFSRGTYLGKPVTVDEKPEDLMIAGRKVEVVNVAIPYVTEKK